MNPAPADGARRAPLHDADLRFLTYTAPSNPGIYNLAVQIDQATRAINDFSVITLVPFSEKRSGRIGLYYLGNWPYERGGNPRTPSYANPSGFIKVTPENADTWVSAHFRLRDFNIRLWPEELAFIPHAAAMDRSRTSTCAGFGRGGAARETVDAVRRYCCGRRSEMSRMWQRATGFIHHVPDVRRAADPSE